MTKDDANGIQVAYNVGVTKPSTPEQNLNKQLKQLRAEYQMYTDYIEDTYTNPRNSKIAKEDLDASVAYPTQEREKVKAAYIKLGGDPKDFEKDANESSHFNMAIVNKTRLENDPDQPRIIEEIKAEDTVTTSHTDIVEKTLDDIIGEKKMLFAQNANNFYTEVAKPVYEGPIPNQQIESAEGEMHKPVTMVSSNNTETKNVWDGDMIPLPSGGQCYQEVHNEVYDGRIDKIRMSYLTADDENMVFAPNLYRDNKVLDYILKEKIVDKNIDPDQLIEGDRDQLILWLRATAYGNTFPISATDPVTGQRFDSSIDLTTIKQKPFNLKGDERGYFDFVLPMTKAKVKFRFLTHQDLQNLDMLKKLESFKLRKNRIASAVSELEIYLGNENLSSEERIKLAGAIKDIKDWGKSLPEKDALVFTRDISNHLEMSIMSINGKEDRKYIKEFIHGMPAGDGSALRHYITENEPGMDFNIQVPKPKSLGGGSLDLFLQIDQYIFLSHE